MKLIPLPRITSKRQQLPPTWITSLTADYIIMGLTLAAYVFIINKFAKRSE